MAFGEVLGAGWTVLRRHLLPLGGLGVALALASAAVLLGTLALTNSLDVYASGRWITDLQQGRLGLPGGIVVASLLSLLVSGIGAPVIAGVAAAYTGAQALGASGRGAVGERLHGRWPVLLTVAILVAVAISVGLLVLVVPGIVLYLMLVFAAPVSVLERGSVRESLRRSVLLTRGHRWRILGAVVVTSIAGGVGGTALAGAVGAALGNSGTVGSQLITQLATSLVSGVAAAWTGCVIAVLYIDVRIRTEQLGQALGAAAQRQRFTPNDPRAS